VKPQRGPTLVATGAVQFERVNRRVDILLARDPLLIEKRATSLPCV